MATITISESIRGKPVASLNGYSFVFHKFGDEKRIWVCDRYRHAKCPARMHTSIGLENVTIISELGSHNHPENPINVELRQVRTKIRQDAKSTNDQPASIISRNVGHVSAAAQGVLPLKQNLKRTIRDVRASGVGSLVQPHRREDIVLPASFQKSKGGADFLLFDSGPEASRILVFATRENLDFLASCPVWLADGTFKVAPSLFDQLFVLHGIRGGVTCPLVYALLPNRKTETYSRVLSALLDSQAGLAPTTIMTDFERAELSAFNEAFPRAEQKGCFFHFSQCFYRHIQKFPEILNRFTTDSNFSLNIWNLVALAFVPPDDVLSTYELLIREEFFVDNAVLLVDFIWYFERTWLGPWNPLRTARVAPLYAIPLWNCFHSVLEDLPKTNNACEGFNSGFSSLLGASHPTIYKLIDGLKEQQVLTELTIHQRVAGTVPTPRKKFAIASTKLRKVVEQYGVGDFCHIDYLRQISYRVRFH